MYNLAQIKDALKSVDGETQLRCIQEAFTAYSSGAAVVPPVGHLAFQQPPGDVHIKYGYIPGDLVYVIKIASGFYQNPAKGLPSSNGMMLAFDAETGAPRCLLQDEGYLTDLRTALAGAVAAQTMGPKEVTAIGILGTGIQARFQLDCLRHVTDCRQVMVWGRSADKASAYQQEVESWPGNYRVTVADNPAQVAASCNLIVTTTPSEEALLQADDIRPGTHITAMGSDTPGKQELATELVSKADVLACDSISQCITQGESGWAIRAASRSESDLVEVGTLISNRFVRQPDMITVADLTGIATQDIKITALALAHLQASNI